MNRKAQFEKILLQQRYDVCIIGGGATGAGIALDAQKRGLSVILIDKGDFGGQTSSKSTKLIHGGVRYLEQAFKKLDWAQLKMVYKALHERNILLKNAPHLSRKLNLITPCKNIIEAVYFTIGLKMYDWLAGKNKLEKSQWLNKKQTLEQVKELNPQKTHSSVIYSDGQFDDARYCLSIIQTAEKLGATVLNYAEILGFNETNISENKNIGKLKALTFLDKITLSQHQISAKVFINATGPFGDVIRKMANPKLQNRIKVSRGAHIILAREVMQSSSAILIPKTKDGRVIFMIPWQDQLLVGTTDEPDVLTDSPEILEEERDYLLQYANEYLNKKLTKKDIKSSFVGQRPLIQPILDKTIQAETKSLVRDHEVEIDHRSKLVSVLGGKWTTYRLMAKDALDQIYKEIWHKKAVACSTENQLLFGAENYNFEEWKDLKTQYPISEFTAQHLLKKYGCKANEVLQLGKTDATLFEILSENHPFIKAEIKYTILNEMATNIDDIMYRRLGLGFRDHSAIDNCKKFIEQCFSELTIAQCEG